MSGKALEVKQFSEFAASVVRQLPRDIDPNEAQGWIDNQAALQRVLRTALTSNSNVKRSKKNEDVVGPRPFRGSNCS